MLSSPIMTETIYVVVNLFSTPLFTWENCNLDLVRLEKKFEEYKKEGWECTKSTLTRKFITSSGSISVCESEFFTN